MYKKKCIFYFVLILNTFFISPVVGFPWDIKVKGNYAKSCAPNSCSRKENILTCTDCNGLASSLDYTKCSTLRVEMGGSGRLVCATAEGSLNASDTQAAQIVWGGYAKSCAPRSCSIVNNIITCTDCNGVASSLDFMKCSTRRVEIDGNGRLVCANVDGGLNAPETQAAQIVWGNYAKGCAPNSCSIKGNILTCTDCAKVASSLDFTKCSTRRVGVGVGSKLVCTNPDGGLNMGDTVAAYRGAGKEFPPSGSYESKCAPNSCSIKGNILTCTDCAKVASSLDYTKCSIGRVEVGIGSKLVCANPDGGLNMGDTVVAYRGAGKEFPPSGSYESKCTPNSCSIKGNILTCTDCAKVASSLDFTKCSTHRVEVGIGSKLVCATADGAALNLGDTVAAYRGAGNEFPPLGNYLTSCTPNSCSIKGNILTCTSLTGVATSLDFTKCSTHRVEMGQGGQLVCATADGAALNLGDTVAAYQGAGKVFTPPQPSPQDLMWEGYDDDN